MDGENERGFGEVVEREDATEETDSMENEQVEETTDTTEEENNSEQTDNQEGEEGNENQEDGDDSQEPKLTEKGTKLDPKPESAVHQQLANERRVRSDYEKVLANPKLITRFLKEQYGIEVPTNDNSEKKTVEETTITPTKKWTGKDFENIDDVADKFNQLQETFTQTMSQKDKKIEDLEKQVNGITTNGRMNQIADTAESDVTTLRAAPELNPNSPEFVPGLEGRIANRYKQLDFDPETGAFRGNYTIREIGEEFLAIAREARKAGVKRGQTIVKDKTGGKIRTTPGATDKTSTDSMSPGASIAQGVSKMFR